jgi:probable rRNA maturation factor
MSIVTASRQRARKINRRLLKQIIAALLTDLKIETADLGIQLVDAPEMTQLNEKFLRHAGSTDVITFDYSAPRRQLHGEIFVCVDEAVRQARKFGTSWQSEVVRYIVHGVLHLLGFDDSNAGVRRKMKREENRRLRELSRRFALSKL